MSCVYALLRSLRQSTEGICLMLLTIGEFLYNKATALQTVVIKKPHVKRRFGRAQVLNAPRAGRQRIAKSKKGSCRRL
eukprot:3939719-Karenia_brevis.AAC.1